MGKTIEIKMILDVDDYERDKDKFLKERILEIEKKIETFKSKSELSKKAKSMEKDRKEEMDKKSYFNKNKDTHSKLMDNIKSKAKSMEEGRKEEIDKQLSSNKKKDAHSELMDNIKAKAKSMEEGRKEEIGKKLSYNEKKDKANSPLLKEFMLEAENRQNRQKKRNDNYKNVNESSQRWLEKNGSKVVAWFQGGLLSTTGTRGFQKQCTVEEIIIESEKSPENVNSRFIALINSKILPRGMGDKSETADFVIFEDFNSKKVCLEWQKLAGKALSKTKDFVSMSRPQMFDCIVRSYILGKWVDTKITRIS